MEINSFLLIILNHFKEYETNMYKLLSYAYQREWEKERNDDFRITAAKNSTPEHEILHRKVFKKKSYYTGKKPLPIITLKR